MLHMQSDSVVMEAVNQLNTEGGASRWDQVQLPTVADHEQTSDGNNSRKPASFCLASHSPYLKSDCAATGIIVTLHCCTCDPSNVMKTSNKPARRHTVG